MNFKEKLKKGLVRTKQAVTNKIKNIFTKQEINEEAFDELEEILIKSDVGIKTTMDIIEKLRSNKTDIAGVYDILKEDLKNLLPNEAPDIQDKKIILVLGVNGAGKTTSIAKLANFYKKEGKNVLIAAGDTFRAGAIDQLQIWAKRIGVELIKQDAGSDPSSVVYDGVSAVLSGKTDILIIDTAGRLHTNINLLSELKKIQRTILKRIDAKDVESIIVLDANTGNNSLEQAKAFSKEIQVDSIFLAKLDSSAKGGFIFSIAGDLDIPVRYIGVGESCEDMLDFSRQEFIETLFE